MNKKVEALDLLFCRSACIETSTGWKYQYLGLCLAWYAGMLYWRLSPFY